MNEVTARTVTLLEHSYSILAAIAREGGQPLADVLDAAIAQYATARKVESCDASRGDDAARTRATKSGPHRLDDAAAAEQAQASWNDVLSDHLDNA